MFLENLDLVGICVQDQRRIEVMAEVVFPLRANGQRHIGLVVARRRKERLIQSWLVTFNVPSWPSVCTVSFLMWILDF